MWGYFLLKRGDFLLITLQQLKTALQAVKNYITNVMPTKTSDLTNDSGFGTYTKPSSGIPASDLADEYIKTTDYATQTTGGIVKVVASGYYGVQMSGTDNQILYISPALAGDIKPGETPYKPVTPINQHQSAFYGLAKAAGDTTQSASDNAVGTYTDTAKTKIKEMLGVEKTVTVNGASPTITAEADTRYICGEVTSLSFTPCSSGICDVQFTSGSTVTVLTLPSTVKFPGSFDPTSLETNTIYEINILDGVYGVVMSWAV